MAKIQTRRFVLHAQPLSKILATVLLSPWVFSAHAGLFEDCILQNMKGVQSQNAARAIYQACQEKTTPKKCRDSELVKVMNESLPDAFKDLTRPTSEAIAQERRKCLEQCATNSYWSRTFGECSTD
jgi:hypothetical protein